MYDAAYVFISRTIHFKLLETQKFIKILLEIFKVAGFFLIDYKLEFGRFNETIILGDEISPDSMRLWDINTFESFAILDMQRERP